MSVSVHGTNGVTFNDGSLQKTSAQTGFRNRIINGDMRIDQRNAGASVTINNSNSYTLDRWQAHDNSDGTFTVERSTTAPASFTNSLKITVTGTDSTIGTAQNAMITQAIEGFNAGDLAWGTASAQSVTLSFWVNSSSTGTFTGAINNSAYNRSYPFSYTISSANTWEKKTISISGDTSGTWTTDNSAGIRLWFSIAVGSSQSGSAGSWYGAEYYGATGQTNLLANNGATFYITGVQFEVGSTATDFERRPIGTELALCQRYFTDAGAGWVGIEETTTTFYTSIPLPVVMRATPTATIISSNISTRIVGSGSDRTITGCAFSTYTISSRGGWLYFTCSGGNVASRMIFDRDGSSIVRLSAEL